MHMALRPSVKLDRQFHETSLLGLQLMRRLATMHEQNAEDILLHAESLSLLEDILNAVPHTPPLVVKEALATVNVLTRLSRGRSKLRKSFTLEYLSGIVQRNNLLVTEAVVDLYFSLYEAELEYVDDHFRYIVNGNESHEDFVKLVIEQCVQTLVISFPSARNVDVPLGSVNALAVMQLDSVARILFKLERTLGIVSDYTAFISSKIVLCQICMSLVNDDPMKFNVKLASVVDIISLLLRGAERCWLSATFDPLDNDFIHVSSALVEQFLSVTQKKLFDHKDEHSLHYLAGCDNKSPIQTMIAKSSEEETALLSSSQKQRHQSKSFSQRLDPSNYSVSPKSEVTSPHGSDNVISAHDHPNHVEGPSAQSVSTSGIAIMIHDQTQQHEDYLSAVDNLLQKLLKGVLLLQRSVTYWELDNNDVNARRLCYLSLFLRLFGTDHLSRIIPDFSSIQNFCFHVLTDPSLGLLSTPGMEAKAIETLSLLILQVGTFDGAMQFYELLLRIIFTNPENLCERYRSEYIREGVSIVAGGAAVSVSSPMSNPSLIARPSSLDLMSVLLSSDSATLALPGGGNDAALVSSLATAAPNDLLYHAINALLVLAEVDRSVRRKLVASCSQILDAVYYYGPVDAVCQRPLLHLLASFTEFASKFELDAEEAIVTSIIRNLSSPLHHVRFETCDLIYRLGSESPGFVFRGLSRREVEDQMLDILSHTPFDYPRLIVAAVKATAMLVHNFNIKPAWLPSPVLYHWRVYQPTLRHRPLLGVQGLSLIIHLLQHAPIPYRLLYFTYTLSLSASLMYAVAEHSGNPLAASDLAGLQALKDYLLTHVLPWLPLAIDFISLGKRKRRFDFMTMLSSTSSSSSPAHSPSSTGHIAAHSASHAGHTNPESLAGASVLSPVQKLLLSRLFDPEVSILGYFEVSLATAAKYSGSSGKSGSSAPSLSATRSTASHQLEERKHLQPLLHHDNKNHHNHQKHSHHNHHNNHNQHTKPTVDEKSWSAGQSNTHSEQNKNMVTSAAASEGQVPSSPQSPRTKDIYRSKAMEFLTAKTIEALYSFLCMDEMYPLSTYLRYGHLFDHCHVIASVSYFMSENFENAGVLKRGLDLLRYFADHQMQVSSIAMHSPPALIAAVRTLSDTLEVQLSFARIVVAVTRIDDDFAKENLLRFRVHHALTSMLQAQYPHGELVRLCLQALWALAMTSEAHAKEVCKTPRETAAEAAANAAAAAAAAAAQATNGGIESPSVVNKDHHGHGHKGNHHQHHDKKAEHDGARVKGKRPSATITTAASFLTSSTLDHKHNPQDEENNLVDAIVHLLDTQHKDAKLQYLALRLLVLLEQRHPRFVQHNLRKYRTTWSRTINKSQKLLRKVYIDDPALQQQQQQGGGNATTSVTTGANNGGGRSLSTSGTAGAVGEDITRRDVELLLQEPLVKNDRCSIS